MYDLFYQVSRHIPLLQLKIQTDEFGFSCLYLPDHLGRDGGLTHSSFSPAQDPVYSSRLLVSAIVATDRLHLHVWILLLESVQSLLGPLRKHSTHRHFSVFTILEIHETGTRQEQKLHSNRADCYTWFGHTLESMFMPMASPVWDWKRMYKFLPAKPTNSFSRRANLPRANINLWSVCPPILKQHFTDINKGNG